MGLLKTIPTKYGIDAKYSTITRRYLDDETQTGVIIVKSYVNRAAYRAGAAPLMEHIYPFTLLNWPFDKNSGVPQFYAAVKAYTVQNSDGTITPSIFADAVDELGNV